MKIRKRFIIATLIIVSGGFLYTVLAAPPSSPYSLGETLAPTCSPGDANCTVDSPQTSHAYLSDISNISASQGDIVYFDGTDWVNLGAATSGRVLITQGAGGNPVWGSNLYWDNANGRLGIGTASPSNKVSIAFTGNSSVSTWGQSIIMNQSSTGGLTGLWIQNTITEDTNPGTNRGLSAVSVYSGVGTQNGHRPIEGVSRLTSAGTLTNPRVLMGQLQNTSTGTISEGVVLRGLAENSSGGLIDGLSLVKINVLDTAVQQSGSVINNLRFLDLTGSTFTGTVNQSYGLYMDTSIDLSATTTYAIYSSSASDSYLQGKLGIATGTPQSALHVADGSYAQFSDNNTGAPASGDCDADIERGRISIDITNNRLYICNGATRGWDYIDLTD